MRISDVIADGYFRGSTEANRRKCAKKYLRARWPEGLGTSQHPRFRARWLPFVRQALGRRDGIRCAVCLTEPNPSEMLYGGWPVWLEVDHVIPLEHNGDHHIDNLRLLCKGCNKSAWRDARSAAA